MSGPKVVRIVTREEIEAICRRHIAAVAASQAELLRRASRCGMLDPAFQKAIAERLTAFKAMFAHNAWMEIQKGAPAAVAFMRSEGDRLEAKAAAAAAAARTRRRRATDAARSVAAAIVAAGGKVPAGLRAAAEGTIASPEEVERVVAAALALAPAPRSNSAAAGSGTTLARRLADGESSASIAELVTARSSEPTATERRLDQLLAELELLTNGGSSFASRADSIAREPDRSRRALLTDSLILEASAHVAVVRAREAAKARLREAANSLAATPTPEAAALRARLSSAAEGESPELEGALEAQAASLIEEHARSAAASARRRAVLAGLASLGYEIRETMAAAWAQEGRIIVRKPGATDYGIELGAPADAARLQVRLVGSDSPETPRDTLRDADQETIWCSDFDRLKGELTAAGTELVLETQMAAGAVPVRTVAMPGLARAGFAEHVAPFGTDRRTSG